MFPLGMIGGTVIICNRVGWGGIFTLVVPLVVFPISLFISRRIKDYILRINVSKDGRIKLCSEIIEGIKFIKLYGWEMAFKRKIQALRETEIVNFIWLAVGRSFEKSISNSVAYFSGFFIFLVADYMGTLTIENIFASIEILTYLRFQFFYFISGLSLFFELEVTFDRFASVIGQDELRMIRWEGKK
jgi:ABC-type multidrug transport system fused ATPase/permease subunit